MPITPAPCEWPVPDPTCCTVWETADPEAKQRAVDTAVFLLWAATGRAYGRCSTTIRPCAQRCTASDWAPRPDGRWAVAGWFSAVAGLMPDARWDGVACVRGCASSCSCDSAVGVALPGWLPEPTEIRIDGQVVPLDEFRVDDGRWLMWQDACGTVGCGHRFPACQNLRLPTSCAGTWAVTYRHGIPVPVAGQLAASELACELLKSCTPGSAGECRLPTNVKAIHRQGVDIEYDTGTPTAAGAAAQVRFNIPAVDLWVTAVNPFGISQPATAWSPDQVSPRVQTWP